MQKSKLTVHKTKVEPLTKHKIRKSIVKVNQKIKDLEELWKVTTDQKEVQKIEKKLNNTKNRLTELQRQDKQVKI